MFCYYDKIDAQGEGKYFLPFSTPVAGNEITAWTGANTLVDLPLVVIN